MFKNPFDSSPFDSLNRTFNRSPFESLDKILKPYKPYDEPSRFTRDPYTGALVDERGNFTSSYLRGDGSITDAFGKIKPFRYEPDGRVSKMEESLYPFAKFGRYKGDLE